jgi:hypothetical protein
VFCNDIGNLLKKTGLSGYDPREWRLFIDSSKRSLTCVLLNNGNKDGSCTEYMMHKLPGLTMEKLKAEIFDGP